MPTDIKIEIKCIRDKDGSYNAFTLQDGAQLTEYAVNRGSCDDIRTLFRKLMNIYGANSIQVSAPCSECLMEL
jgi:hypothetical protein